MHLFRAKGFDGPQSDGFSYNYRNIGKIHKRKEQHPFGPFPRVEGDRKQEIGRRSFFQTL